MRFDGPVRPFSFLAGAAWTLASAVFVSGLISLIDSVHPGAFVDVVTVATCKVLACSLVLFALLRVYQPDASIRRVLALRPASPLTHACAALFGLGCAPFAMWLDGTLARRFPPPAVETEALERIFATPTIGRKIALFVSLVVVIPVCDELFFRGALFTSLKRAHRVHAVVLAAAVYDTLLVGANAHDVVSMLAMSLALGWIRALSGSVVASLFARVAFFAVQVVPLLLMQTEPTAARFVAGGMLLALVSMGALIVVSRRSSRAKEARSLDTF
jgi:membrane protease YdiL (CAAX protease family)